MTPLRNRIAVGHAFIALALISGARICRGTLTLKDHGLI